MRWTTNVPSPSWAQACRNKNQLPHHWQTSICILQGGETFQTLLAKEQLHSLHPSPSSSHTPCIAIIEWTMSKLDDKLARIWSWRQASTHFQSSWDLQTCSRSSTCTKGGRRACQLATRSWNVCSVSNTHRRWKLLVRRYVLVLWEQHHTLSLFHQSEEGFVPQSFSTSVGSWSALQEAP